MSGDIQLTLFDPPNLIGPLGHQWTWTPAYSLCVECRRLWLATDSREQVVTHLTEPCPGPPPELPPPGPIRLEGDNIVKPWRLKGPAR